MLRRLLLSSMTFLYAGIAFASAGEYLPPSNSSEYPSKEHHKSLSFNGYIDASYNYLLRSNQFISGSYNRTNDFAMNNFSLQQLAGTLALTPEEGFGGLINGFIGRDAITLSPRGLDSNVFNSEQIGATVRRAYLQFSKSNFTFKVGEMSSLVGIESYDYTRDDNFSSSLLDSFAQPGAQVGMRGLHQLNEKIKLVGGLYNGWSTIHHPASLNHVEFGINYLPISTLSMMLDITAGDENFRNGISHGPVGRRYLIDFYGTWYLTNKLSVATNLDYVTQNKAMASNNQIERVYWEGVAGYVKYLFNDRWIGAIRGEIYSDPQGYTTGVNQVLRELTLTVGYIPFKALELRAETRHDISNNNAFFTKTGGGTSNNQQSYSLEALYQF